MKTNGLETWLNKWTDFSYRDRNGDFEELEFIFNINYIHENRRAINWSNDNETMTLAMEERLIHPVLLSQHLKQEIISMEKELTILTMQRLKDSELNLGLIHI